MDIKDFKFFFQSSLALPQNPRIISPGIGQFSYIVYVHNNILKLIIIVVMTSV